MSEDEKLARIMQEQRIRATTPHIPPDYIVRGECTLDALNRYLTIHPMNTMRAKEAWQMCLWMNPLLVAQITQPPWGIRDIIGDMPAQEEEG